MTDRRTFLCKIIPLAALGGIFASRFTYAQGLLSEQDPHAIAMDYVNNSKRANQAKHPKHSSEQTCHNCQLFNAAAETSGHCAVFPGNLVSANGWCKAYIKKS